LPALSQLYCFYFSRVLPWIGQRLSRNSYDAYQYLPNSVQSFPSGIELVKRLEAAGLEDVRCLPLTFGIASIYIGDKAT
jgi:demethylmenaquinone methyltransferase/2-methoxy-6-polyprenyl-1,4-benzoquinol methylase